LETIGGKEKGSLAWSTRSMNRYLSIRLTRLQIRPWFFAKFGAKSPDYEVCHARRLAGAAENV
jgi:hypothetical protein